MPSRDTLTLFADVSASDEALRLNACLSLTKHLVALQTTHEQTVDVTAARIQVNAQYAATMAAADLRKIFVPSAAAATIAANGGDVNVSLNAPSPIDALCHADVSYALKRLVRGLASDRDAARLGFCTVLAALLDAFLWLPLEAIVELSFAYSAMLGDTPHHVLAANVERDLIFGRVACMALVGRTLASASKENVLRYTPLVRFIFEELAAYALRRRCYKALCFETAARIANSASLRKVSLFNAKNGKDEANSFLQWYVRLAAGDEDVIFPTANVPEIKAMLVEATDCLPHLSPIWRHILRWATCDSRIKHFDAFWREFVDEALFSTASHDKKHLGFIVAKWIVLHHASAAGAIFSDNFVRTLNNNISGVASKKGNWLAGHVIDFVATVRSAVAADGALALRVALALFTPRFLPFLHCKEAYALKTQLIATLSLQDLGVVIERLLNEAELSSLPADALTMDVVNACVKRVFHIDAASSAAFTCFRSAVRCYLLSLFACSDAKVAAMLREKLFSLIAATFNVEWLRLLVDDLRTLVPAFTADVLWARIDAFVSSNAASLSANPFVLVAAFLLLTRAVELAAAEAGSLPIDTLSADFDDVLGCFGKSAQDKVEEASDPHPTAVFCDVLLSLLNNEHSSLCRIVVERSFGLALSGGWAAAFGEQAIEVLFKPLFDTFRVAKQAIDEDADFEDVEESADSAYESCESLSDVEVASKGPFAVEPAVHSDVESLSGAESSSISSASEDDALENDAEGEALDQSLAAFIAAKTAASNRLKDKALKEDQIQFKNKVCSLIEALLTSDSLQRDNPQVFCVALLKMAQLMRKMAASASKSIASVAPRLSAICDMCYAKSLKSGVLFKAQSPLIDSLLRDTLMQLLTLCLTPESYPLLFTCVRFVLKRSPQSADWFAACFCDFFFAKWVECAHPKVQISLFSACIDRFSAVENFGLLFFKLIFAEDRKFIVSIEQMKNFKRFSLLHFIKNLVAKLPPNEIFAQKHFFVFDSAIEASFAKDQLVIIKDIRKIVQNKLNKKH